MIVMSRCWEPLACDVGVVVSPCRRSLHLERGSGESRAERICNHAESRIVFIARDGDAAIYRKYTSLGARNYTICRANFMSWRNSYGNSTEKMPKTLTLRKRRRLRESGGIVLTRKI